MIHPSNGSKPLLFSHDRMRPHLSQMKAYHKLDLDDPSGPCTSTGRIILVSFQDYEVSNQTLKRHWGFQKIQLCDLQVDFYQAALRTSYSASAEGCSQASSPVVILSILRTMQQSLPSTAIAVLQLQKHFAQRTQKMQHI